MGNYGFMKTQSNGLSFEYICPKCGYRENFSERKTCPCCKGALSKNKGFYIEWRTDWRNAEVKSNARAQLEKDRHAVQKEEAQKRVNEFVKKYNEKSSYSIDSNLSIEINNSKEMLIEYLRNVIRVESHYVALTRQLTTLYEENAEAKRNACASKYFPLMSAKDEVQICTDELKKKKSLLEKSKNDLDNYDKKIVLDPPPKEPVMPIYAKPTFFNKWIVRRENKRRQEEYELACEKYKQELKSYNAKNKRKISAAHNKAQALYASAEMEVSKAEMRLRKATEELQGMRSQVEATPEKAYEKLLNNEIKETEKLLLQVISCRNKMYSVGVIYEKYRNLVALSAIYEYLVAGRCITLGGADGAYNIFESELCANVIINKLDVVVDSLDAMLDKMNVIQNGQSVIYEEMHKVNENLNSIKWTAKVAVKELSKISSSSQNMEQYMKSVANSCEVIAHNTAVTAYYSKINADLTNSLGYMMALR